MKRTASPPTAFVKAAIGDTWLGEPCSECSTRPNWKDGWLNPCHCGAVQAPDGPLLLTWEEYKEQAAARPEGEFVIPGLYRRGQSSLLVGEPKAGKSTLCRRIALEVGPRVGTCSATRWRPPWPSTRRSRRMSGMSFGR